MSVIYYDPFTEFDRLFDDAFSSRFSGSGQGSRPVTRSQNSGTVQTFKPRMDLHENAQSNTVTATFELPGLKKEDVSIDVHSDRLTVSGEAVISKDLDQSGYAVRERSFGKFSRTLRIPQGIRPEDIKASMQEGILTVTFPKTSPEQAPRRITVA